MFSNIEYNINDKFLFLFFAIIYLDFSQTIHFSPHRQKVSVHFSPCDAHTSSVVQGRVLEGQGLPKLEPEPQALPCLMPEAWPEGTLVQKCKLLNLLLNTATAKIIYIYRKIRCISIHIRMIRARRAIGTFLFSFF